MIFPTKLIITEMKPNAKYTYLMLVHQFYTDKANSFSNEGENYVYVKLSEFAKKVKVSEFTTLKLHLDELIKLGFIKITRYGVGIPPRIDLLELSGKEVKIPNSIIENSYLKPNVKYTYLTMLYAIESKIWPLYILDKECYLLKPYADFLGFTGVLKAETLRSQFGELEKEGFIKVEINENRAKPHKVYIMDHYVHQLG